MVCVLFLVTTTPKELGLESLLLSASMLVNNINALAFAVYSITTLIIYKALFRACLNGIRNTLHHGDGVALLKRLQHQQQFYIVVCSNYKKHVFGFGNPIFYTGQLVFTVLSVVQAYFFAFEPVDEGEGYWFVFFSKFYHSFLSVMSAVICIEANSIHFMSRDLISFLYKYRINKLSDAEALQVEMLLITLHTEKPVLTASNLFTFGISLLASVSGTAVTYVLVALQFHASL
ncbi:hypothetical protein NQ315_004394 [Exocentrus adspersus]|uniref:Gustatory receptor n=1 Tax=Exocentrus adspersus TaxID=1586481 RepID=A0AAV8W8L2_9CUCU|nr:hypothetical protein NQ315_004394 [Exocentrus adspersus]